MVDWLAEWRRAVSSPGGTSLPGETSLPSETSFPRETSSETPLPSETSLPSHLMVWEDYVHGLSQVEYHRGSGRDLPAWSRATQSDRDHVASLDGLAFLLVFRPKGDPVDDSEELRYIKELLERSKKGTAAKDLLKTVILMCREKIFHRIKKLAKSFGVSQTDQKLEESNLWQYNETKEPCQKLEAALKKIGWLKDNGSTFHLLDGFTRLVGRITKTSEAEDFWRILYFSWFVTSVTDLHKILGEIQIRYLSKLGDYVRILMRIPLLLTKAGNAKVTIEQVLPPAAELIEVYSGSLEVLNLRCGHIISEEITPIKNWDLVTDEYQKAQPGQPAVGKKKVKFTQHCEITLALDMLKRTPRRIEIGVSKACCEWCCEYLNLLASLHPQYPILVRASHGKQPDGWMMPPNGPKAIAQQMIRSIEERVDNVIWRIHNRRRSDSNELPSFSEEVDVEASRQDLAGEKDLFQEMNDHS